MPTKPDSPAATAAQLEAELWASLASSANAIASEWDDVPPTEFDVVGFDPTGDLERRTRAWGHILPDLGVAELCRFAAGLALAEADGWRDDHPQLATRAYEDRRFLVSDRILHWAVPWLDMAGRCVPSIRTSALEVRDELLDIADALRPAPVLVAGSEGLHLPGEDSYGPTSDMGLGTLRCGVLLLRATIRSLTGDPQRSRSLLESDLAEDSFRETFATLFDVACARWRGVATLHPGSAQLWLDLAARAERTASAVRTRVI